MELSNFFKKKNAVKVGTPLEPMGEFPLIKAHDVIVAYDEATGKETRLDEKLKNLPTSSVEVTSDFTEAGAGKAADAKAVGDRINETLGNIDDVLKQV